LQQQAQQQRGRTLEQEAGKRQVAVLALRAQAQAQVQRAEGPEEMGTEAELHRKVT